MRGQHDGIFNVEQRIYSTENRKKQEKNLLMQNLELSKGAGGNFVDFFFIILFVPKVG